MLPGGMRATVEWSYRQLKKLITEGLSENLAAKQDVLVSGTDIITINNTTLLSDGNMTLATPADVAAGVGIVEQKNFQDLGTDLGATTYTIDFYAMYKYTINSIKIISSLGTCTAALKINGVAVTGISAVSVSSTVATGTATAANTVAVGDTVTLVTTSPLTLNELQASIKITRT